MKKECNRMGRYVLRETQTGIRFSLKAGNGEIIGISETYSTEVNCMKGVESVKKNAPAASLEDQTTAGFQNQLNPKYEIYLDKAGEYRFRLKARNGQIILSSEGYTKKRSCLRGIESVRKNAVTEDIVREENI